MAGAEDSNGLREARSRYDTLARRLRAGHKHPTLGFHPDIGDLDWWQAGKDRFAMYVKTFAIAPRHRVIDYGCGTLRLGGHFMQLLEPGHYFGLDASRELIEIGRELVGSEVIGEKSPHLAAIGEDSLADAEAFNADFVFSEAVSYHVVPEERAFYYGALRRLAHVPGSVLFFSVSLADTEREYLKGCWCWPLEAYVEAVAPLSFVTSHFMHVSKESSKHPGVNRAVLEFRRV